MIGFTMIAGSGLAIMARPKGSDLRSHRIEAYREVILGAVAAWVGITLVELAEMLSGRSVFDTGSGMKSRRQQDHLAAAARRHSQHGSLGGSTAGRG